jgi:GAF domain-containing protein
MNMDEKMSSYEKVVTHIDALIDGQTDQIAIMSTMVCELHMEIDYFHWTGFYRVTEPECLHVGPYQGGHGCLFIPFNRGICGQAARTKSTVIVGNVNSQFDHIACSASTLSEIVVPVLDQKNTLLAVLDVDSDIEDAFDDTDRYYLEKICSKLSGQGGTK